MCWKFTDRINSMVHSHIQGLLLRARGLIVSFPGHWPYCWAQLCPLCPRYWVRKIARHTYGFCGTCTATLKGPSTLLTSQPSMSCAPSVPLNVFIETQNGLENPPVLLNWRLHFKYWLIMKRLKLKVNDLVRCSHLEPSVRFHRYTERVKRNSS